LAGEGGSHAPSPLVGAGSGACFAASPDIRHAEVEGLRVLLDLRTESYRVLNEAGSAMWSVLTGEADELAALGSLERRYCADLDRLHSDLASFARRLLAEGVFAPAGEASEASPEAASAQARGACFGEAGGRPPPPPRVNETLLPLSGLGRGVAIFEALSALTATWFALARSGFAPTYLPTLSSVRRLRAPSFRAFLPPSDAPRTSSSCGARRMTVSCGPWRSTASYARTG
jgi:hypothetical protein